MVIGWENVDNLEDYYITYLLYKESLNVEQIARVRNKSVEQVNEDLITAKDIIRKTNKSIRNLNEKKDILDYFLSLSKDERIDFMSNMKDSDINNFKRKVYNGILRLENIDDLMVLVWTAGEFRDSRFLEILYPITEKRHANIRRIAYSAIGKIGSVSSSIVMEMGLSDSNPQVRQYCAKALGFMGSKDSVKILENLIKFKSDFEKEYVLRAARESLGQLYARYGI